MREPGEDRRVRGENAAHWAKLAPKKGGGIAVRQERRLKKDRGVRKISTATERVSISGGLPKKLKQGGGNCIYPLTWGDKHPRGCGANRQDKK